MNKTIHMTGDCTDNKTNSMTQVRAKIHKSQIFK